MTAEQINVATEIPMPFPLGETATIGSVRNKGDRVCFTYFEDEDGKEMGYGTVIGEKDKDTAIVLVILEGRKKQIRDELPIPYSELMPHLSGVCSEDN